MAWPPLPPGCVHTIYTAPYYLFVFFAFAYGEAEDQTGDQNNSYNSKLMLTAANRNKKWFIRYALQDIKMKFHHTYCMCG